MAPLLAVRTRYFALVCRCLSVFVLVMAPAFAEVWTGPTVTFSKTGADDPTDPAFQDAITANVVITRPRLGGIYNIAQETGFSQTDSPRGTEWAFSGVNTNPSGAAFSASACAATPSPCFMQPWFEAQGENSMGELIQDRPAVVHLIAEDIWIDVLFTEWTIGGLGSRVTYERSSPGTVPVPLPLWALALVAAGFAAAGARVRNRPSRSQ